MKSYITQLTQLKLSHAEALKQAGAFTDPDLSDEGIAKRRQELSAAANNNHHAKLQALTQEVNSEITKARSSAAESIPGVPGDTAAGWSLAQMLLSAGQTLHQVVASAEPAVLHAVSQYGPTYLRAQALQGRQDPYAAVTVDTDGLQRSIRQRWAQVLDADARTRIDGGLEAESVDAEFRISAEHFENKLNGVRTGMDDFAAAIEASLAGKAAAGGLQEEAA